MPTSSTALTPPKLRDMWRISTSGVPRLAEASVIVYASLTELERQRRVRW